MKKIAEEKEWTTSLKTTRTYKVSRGTALRTEARLNLLGYEVSGVSFCLGYHKKHYKDKETSFNSVNFMSTTEGPQVTFTRIRTCKGDC